ncbi:MAG: zinc finger Ran-binding domain-containing protein [Polyangiaceae bacterium]
MQCTRCGFQNPPEARQACVQCGTPLTLGADPVARALLPVGRTPLSILAGYLGLFAVTCFPAPLALGIGIWAVVDLKKKPGMHGMGRAVFGVVMGAIGTLVILVALVARLLGSR